MVRRVLLAGAAVAMLFGGAGVAHAQGNSPNDPDNIGDHPALYGLCTAYMNNSDQAKRAPPFQSLEQAAEDNDQSVEEFCEGVRPSNGQGNGSDNSQAPDPTE